MSVEAWYKQRRLIVERHTRLRPGVEALRKLVIDRIAGLEPDPVTGKPPISYVPTTDTIGFTVSALTQRTVAVELPIESPVITITPAVFVEGYGDRKAISDAVYGSEYSFVINEGSSVSVSGRTIVDGIFDSLLRIAG